MERANNLNGMNLDEIFQTYSEVMKSILLLGESSLPETRFKAFRKIILDEFSRAQKKIRSRVQINSTSNEPDK